MTNAEHRECERLQIRAYVIGLIAGLLLGALIMCCGCSLTVFEGNVNVPPVGSAHVAVDVSPAPWFTNVWSGLFAETKGLALNLSNETREVTE